MNWKCLFNYHDWVQTVPGSSSNPYDKGKAKCSKCGKTTNIYCTPSSEGITPEEAKVLEDVAELAEIAREGYMKHNFPEGDKGYPPGFPDEMWCTTDRDVRESWYNYARKKLVETKSGPLL
jgi:hypothetical protein